MDIMKAIKERRSIRTYKDKKIEKEKINKVLNAARWAPSATNSQPWEFIIIKTDEMREKVAESSGRGYLADAPVAIAFVTDPSRSSFHQVDGSLATENFHLAASELGLGTCWSGTFDRDEVKEILEIPKEKHLLTVMPLGYPDETGESSRKPLESMVYKEKYGKK